MAILIYLNILNITISRIAHYSKTIVQQLQAIATRLTNTEELSISYLKHTQMEHYEWNNQYLQI